MKKFTIPCQFGSEMSPFNVYVGEPVADAHPLEQQVAWLARMRGGHMPDEVLDSFKKLHDIAKENGVSFEELTVYALGTASGDTPEQQPDSSAG